MGASKFAWRSRLVAAEALLELGRAAEATAELPPASPGNELQDIVYDTGGADGRRARARPDVEEAVALGAPGRGRRALLIFRGDRRRRGRGAGRGRPGWTRPRRFCAGRQARGRPRRCRTRASQRADPARRRRSRPMPARSSSVRGASSRSGPAALGRRAAALAAEAAARSGRHGCGGARSIASCIRSAHAGRAPGARDDAAGGAAALGIDVPLACGRGGRRGAARAGRSGRASRDVAVRRCARVHAVRVGQLAPGARRSPHHAAPLGGHRGRAPAQGSSTSSPATP